MRVSEPEVRRLAERIVEALTRRGYITPAAEAAALADRIGAFMWENFQQEAEIERKAEKLADSYARQMSGMDERRVIQMIKQKLADERGFTL